MDLVRHYQPGKAPPQVKLLIKKIGEGQPTDDNITVTLKGDGIHSPESFLLQCMPTQEPAPPPPAQQPAPPPPPPLPSWQKERPGMHHIILIKYQKDGREVQFRLHDNIQSKWRQLAYLLGVPVDSIEGEEKCLKVMEIWLRKSSEQYPVEWGSIVKVLQDIHMGEVAEELKEALDNQIAH